MCRDCDQAALNPFHGGYCRDCMDCAARKYINVPSIMQVDVLEYFGSGDGSFEREDILARVAELTEGN